MKLITKLQSYTDVITNSSSTVFIMHESDAKFYEKDTPEGCCRIEEIDHQWLLNNRWNWVDCLISSKYHFTINTINDFLFSLIFVVYLFGSFAFFYNFHYTL